MTVFVRFLLQLLIISVGIVYSIPLPAPTGVETHKFRWALGNDLNKTRCAFPSTPWRFSNDTLHPDPNWSKLHGCTILLGAASTPDNDRLICQNNNSLFQLIGNPGMIWHPLSGQCVSTIEIDSNVSGIDTDTNDSVVQITSKTFITSCECDINSPNAAIFEYDKNKPQRLTFVANDPKTGKKDDWCIRQWEFSGIHATLKCDFDPLSTYQDREPFFHEII